jgi:hypothetical protein
MSYVQILKHFSKNSKSEISAYIGCTINFIKGAATCVVEVCMFYSHFWMVLLHLLS